ncbi:hypothetical protein [Nesterenkonia jeotgali]|uniref:Uncharacterized protein n=1 Tax=Nesterenkonia jeotgali TaxID=317018 RepID=A0A839FPV8_9MICC|nr:hypothetical protein [Nesterenkonia jeotgali]MBA8922016.1 hypothetical protein [Nesterenkonia jeotgali]
MYAWLFRSLPGPLLVQILLALAILAGIVFLLMQYVFPWLSQYSPLNDSTLESMTAPAQGRAEGTPHE